MISPEGRQQVLVTGMPNFFGADSVFVMARTSRGVKLVLVVDGVEHESKYFAVGDTFDAGGRSWRIEKIEPTTGGTNVPGSGSGQVVARLSVVA